jgi:hypothetical protein
MGNGSGGTCTICTQYFSVLHWHHTVPQSRGGKDSLQIPLCSSCHNILHANAVALVARSRGSKPKTIQFWASSEQEKRAAPYLEILTKALLLPIAPGYEAQHPIHLTADTSLYEMIKLLQSDLGASSIEKTIRHAIMQTISERGLGNAARNREAQQKSQLWFLQSPNA